MAACDACNSTILFGGKRDANGRFCNQKCQQRGAFLAIAKQIPDATVREQLWKIHQGLCPKCGGSGPVDVHVSHRVWSAVFLTSWKSNPQISCASCGHKSQWTDLGFSLLFGWWGIPWGVIMTPIQIGRNLVGIGKSGDASSPSPQLEKIVRMTMAAQAAQAAAKPAAAMSAARS